MELHEASSKYSMAIADGETSDASYWKDMILQLSKDIADSKK